MAEKLKSNNLEFDSKAFEKKEAANSQDVNSKQNIIEQYKSKLAKAQKELD